MQNNVQQHYHFLLHFSRYYMTKQMLGLVMMTANEQRARLAILVGYSLGRALFAQLMQQTGSAETILLAGREQWRAWGLNEKQQTALATPAWEDADKQLDWQAKNPAAQHLIFWDSPVYPERLAAIPDAPPVLWVRGDIKALSEPQIAIVGSRNASAGGNKIAFDFAQEFAQSGMMVTSGLAGGIDTAAHAGALAATDGQTIGVLGTGVDLIYPSRNKALAEQMLTRGAIVSEFPLGSRAEAWHFPQRNRIISGLSLGILVVEAAENSGSLITARLALEQGRDVFAIPGSIHNPLAKGCHQLIKRGQAKLTETVADVLSELSGQLRPFLAEKTATLPPPDDLSEAAKTLLTHIGYDPMLMDDLLAKAKISTADCASLLLELELSDSVEIYGGNKIARIR
jgi:DNA processing protein